MTIVMNKIKDGAIVAFRVTEIKSIPVDVEMQDPSDSLIKTVKWNKIQVTLTHDASIKGSLDNPYAVANVDPSRPLVMKLHTYIIPGPSPSAAEKPPQSDKQRWAFIKYDALKSILSNAGYVTGKQQKFPLPGVVYSELALSNGNNYCRKFGGPELVDENRKNIENMSRELDYLFSMRDTTEDSQIPLSLP